MRSGRSKLHLQEEKGDGTRTGETDQRGALAQPGQDVLSVGTLAFDVVTSVAGAMFAPRPEVVAKELLRVCRQDGVVAMANWTPQGFVGQMFGIISTFVAPRPECANRRFGRTKPRCRRCLALGYPVWSLLAVIRY